jgi:hypothetical protein
MNGGQKVKQAIVDAVSTLPGGRWLLKQRLWKNGRKRRGSEMTTWRWGTGARISWVTNSPKAAWRLA